MAIDRERTAKKVAVYFLDLDSYQLQFIELDRRELNRAAKASGQA